MAGEALARVQDEINREKANSLARAGGRLQEAICALRLIRHEIEALETARARPADASLDAPEAALRRRAEYSVVRRAALQLRHNLIVQREAMGFRNQRDLDRCYPVPGPLSPPETDRLERFS